MSSCFSCLDASPLPSFIWLLLSFLLGLSFYITPSESLPVPWTWAVHPTNCMAQNNLDLTSNFSPPQKFCLSTVSSWRQLDLFLFAVGAPALGTGALWIYAEWTTGVVLRTLPIGEADYLFLNGLNWCCLEVLLLQFTWVLRGRTCCGPGWCHSQPAELVVHLHTFLSYLGDADVWRLWIALLSLKKIFFFFFANIGIFFFNSFVIHLTTAHNTLLPELRQQSWEFW